MTQGTVTMSLADIDKLRDEVKISNLEKEKALKELIEVKADKRVMKIKEFPSEKDYGISVDIKNLYDYLQRESTIRDYKSFPSSAFSAYGYTSLDLKRYIKVHFNNPLTSDVAFVNFEDAKIELRKKLSEEYEQEIRTLRSEKRGFEDKLQNKVDEITKNYEEVKKKLTKRIEDWEKKYKELEEDKKEKSKMQALEETVIRLRDELQIERNKKWYQKF